MGDFYTFAGDHPIVTVLVVLVLVNFASIVVQQPFRIFNRYIWSKNIRAHGWPPTGMDADGDIVKPAAVDGDA